MNDYWKKYLQHKHNVFELSSFFILLSAHCVHTVLIVLTWPPLDILPQALCGLMEAKFCLVFLFSRRSYFCLNYTIYVKFCFTYKNVEDLIILFVNKIMYEYHYKQFSICKKQSPNKVTSRTLTTSPIVLYLKLHLTNKF